jgi:hypothetical protein
MLHTYTYKYIDAFENPSINPKFDSIKKKPFNFPEYNQWLNTAFNKPY